MNTFYRGKSNKLPEVGAEAPGKVTDQCLNSCWFSVCNKHSVKRVRKCCLVGSYCGTFVCVSKGRGTDELAKLTIAILDFALKDPPPIETKEVIGYLTADGRFATESTASLKIRAEIPFDAAASGIFTPKEAETATAWQQAVNDVYGPEALIPNINNSMNTTMVPESNKLKPLGDQERQKLRNALPSLPLDLQRESFERASESIEQPGTPAIPNNDQLFQQQMRRLGTQP